MGNAGFVLGGAGGWSLITNPTNNWSYGSKPTKTGPFSILVSTMVDGNNKGWEYTDNKQQGNIWKNYGSYYSHGVAPGEISIHPGETGEWTVVRWTAKESGNFRVVGHFGAGDVREVTYCILKNNDNELFIKDMAETTECFDFNVAVAEGDTLDFQIGEGWYFGNTPIDIRIGEDYFNEETESMIRIRNIRHSRDDQMVRNKSLFFKNDEGNWGRVNI